MGSKKLGSLPVGNGHAREGGQVYQGEGQKEFKEKFRKAEDQQRAGGGPLIRRDLKRETRKEDSKASHFYLGGWGPKLDQKSHITPQANVLKKPTGKRGQRKPGREGRGKKNLPHPQVERLHRKHVQNLRGDQQKKRVLRKPEDGKERVKPTPQSST